MSRSCAMSRPTVLQDPKQVPSRNGERRAEGGTGGEPGVILNYARLQLRVGVRRGSPPAAPFARAQPSCNLVQGSSARGASLGDYPQVPRPATCSPRPHEPSLPSRGTTRFPPPRTCTYESHPPLTAEGLASRTLAQRALGPSPSPSGQRPQVPPPSQDPSPDTRGPPPLPSLPPPHEPTDPHPRPPLTWAPVTWQART